MKVFVSLRETGVFVVFLIYKENEKMRKPLIFNLVLSGLFIAIGLVLPTLFHAVSLAGPAFLPMHIPVILCGFICGWKYGLSVGVILPLLSSVTTGMPPIYPVAVSMALELCTYGAISGLLSKKFNTIIALIIAMLSGRVISGIANVILLGLAGKSYSFTMFITGAFVTGMPGIIVQIILIPIIITAIKKNNFMEKIFNQNIS